MMRERKLAEETAERALAQAQLNASVRVCLYPGLLAIVGITRSELF